MPNILESSPRGIVLDMDSSVSPTHGEQENSVWNGHYACTCYHPLFVFNQFGDLERCALRAGNDATVVPNVRRQRGTAPASRACLQPRQFSAHVGDAGADQELVADELEGEVDQDRSEGGEPRPLCYLPDGRGRHRTANVPRDFAAHRGATAAATTSASVRRSMSCIQEQPTEGVRPNARGNGQIRPSTKRSGYPRCW